MIVDDLRCEAHDDGVVRSARVRRAGETARLVFRIPRPEGRELSTELDGSAFLAASVLPAMLSGEDLVVDAPVSPLLRDRIEAVITAYGAWDPDLRLPAVEVAGEREPEGRGSGVACFFSRGADSMASAAVERSWPGPLDHLVFCDGFEPLHSRETAAAEVRLASEVATMLDLPLLVVETNVRLLTEGWRDWADVHGSALAAVALALDGAFGDVVLPSTQAVDEIVPFGSSPVLDHLFSTESVRVHHDDVSLSRAGKVWFLTRQRPDLLPYLKVCFAEDRPDNCGRCGKCIITMCALQAAGGLHLATGFPDRVPLDELRAMRPVPVQSRQHWVAVMRALGGGPNREVRDAIAYALRRSARPGPRERADLLLQWLRGRRASPVPSWRDPRRGFDWRHHAELLSLLTRGRPDRPLSDVPEPPIVRQRARPAAPTPDELRRDSTL